MFELIKKGAKLSEENRPLLWGELVLFSCVSGLLFHSWVVLGVIFLSLAWLLTRANGMFYMIFVLSLIWSIIPFCTGLSFGGWIGAWITTAIAYWMAVKIHINGLKWHWDEVICRHDDVIEWRCFTWSGPNAWKCPQPHTRQQIPYHILLKSNNL